MEEIKKGLTGPMTFNAVVTRWRTGGILLLVSLMTISGVGFAQAQDEDDDLSPGFSTGYRPEKPSAEDIEAGKAVYFTKCVWCHGIDGAGDGPSAKRLPTKPRNFNQGTFKIRHTASGELPTDEDLFLTVTNGLPGSVMPPWGEILSAKQRRQVVAFVKTNLVKDRDFMDEEDEDFTVLTVGTPVPSSEESIERGREVYEKKGKCRECHGDEGRGDGNLTMKDDWKFPIFPADLSKPWNFRGNRRDPFNPANVFREVSTGLNGTPMPSFDEILTIEDRWDVANFVMSLSRHYPIDPETNKPGFSVVIESHFTDAEVPTSTKDERWEPITPHYVGLASQIIRQPRHFIRPIEDVRVRSIFSGTEISFLLEWNDRTKSLRDENKTPIYDTVAVKSTDLTHETNAPEYKGVYNDAIAIQFPEKWEEIPAPEKPYFIHGDAKRGVDIWKWLADGTTEQLTGHGLTDIVLRDTKNVQVLDANFSNGKWSVIMKRSLLTEDKEHDVQFTAGKYVPMNFFAWDGDAGEVDGKMALSTYYYVIMKPPYPTSVYVAPPIAGFIMLAVEGFVFWRVRKKKREGGPR